MDIDPFKNFTPRANPSNAVNALQPQDSGLSADDLSSLESMPIDELRKLLQRVLNAGWGYGKLTGRELVQCALMDKEEAYEALKLTALTLAHNAKEWREFHALASFWAEREKGKPVTPVAVDHRIGIMQIVANMGNVIDVTKDQ